MRGFCLIQERPPEIFRFIRPKGWFSVGLDWRSSITQILLATRVDWKRRTRLIIEHFYLIPFSVNDGIVQAIRRVWWERNKVRRLELNGWSFKESGSPHSNSADCHKFIRSGVSSIPTLHCIARCCLQLLNATSVPAGTSCPLFISLVSSFSGFFFVLSCAVNNKQHYWYQALHVMLHFSVNILFILCSRTSGQEGRWGKA